MKLLLLFFLLITPGAFAQRPAGHADLARSSEQYFKEKMASDHIVGLSAAIIMDGKVIWQQGFGYADRENKTAMTPQTVVNIGSITKTFTALALMQLNEQGKLDINQSLKTYLPRFRPMARPGISPDKITVKSVMTHTSGIQSDIWKNSDLESGKYTDVPGFVNQTYLLYPAGMVGLYSNAGYNLLGNVIKGVSQEDYADYIHRHILDPLGMSHSGFAMDSLQNRSKIYAYGQNFRVFELRDIASGGIYTSLNDFTQYATGLLKAYRGESNAIIKSGSLRKMFSLQNASVPIETNKKGLGWFMFKNDSTFAVYHAGSAGFAQAKLLLIPDKNAAVIVMTNTSEGGQAAEDFCFNLLPRFGLLISDLFPAPITGAFRDTSHVVQLSLAELKKHAGSYGKATSYVSVSVGNNFLRMRENDKTTILKPLSADQYLPYEISGSDTLVKKTGQRFFFTNIRGYHYLIRRTGEREYNWGYRLKPIDVGRWQKRTGLYRIDGYQMLIGDTKFKSVELYITPDRVLMCRLKTMGSTNEVPLDVIDNKHALSLGVNAGFAGFTVSFKTNKGKQYIDFAGINFRK
ncbi:class A beta-lactamase-related serine hydrolase [Mucilaginibacter conchicola]|uniref:Class A beta-lactamase-related serine hydrolase n=1 Tax=Mucilaginibacter conchicola TaxID=2303333 RepID=A0A372NSU0_9SPHI|nr:serine hydrolase domain-containing protein [Mucilaginibacter conchicola]RFZ91343.1 class A beta-lactamase-related serine hydrolase [Mucilaginibacter conchicola]